MPDKYTDLPREGRAEALVRAADASGREGCFLEKDIWGVWSLAALCGCDEIGGALVFKGGTSLSKAYGAITRYSEDIDLTRDIRSIAPDLVGDAPDALPPSGAQARKWTKEIRNRLADWVADVVTPHLSRELGKVEPEGSVVCEDANIFVRYAPLTPSVPYLKEEVKLEFGARATGEPCAPMQVGCDAAGHVSEVAFPSATPRVMAVERTFWEKATAMHVYCHKGKPQDRLSRHWFDLMQLDKGGFADRAMADHRLGDAVAEHKGWFFREKDHDGQWIDYAAAVAGGLQLVPDGEFLETLASDYKRMAESGMLMSDAPPSFDEVMERCEGIAARANAAR